MKKFGHMLCMLVCIAMVCCACRSSSEPLTADPDVSVPDDAPQTSTEEPSVLTDIPYVGVVLKATDNPYFALLKAGVEYEADLLGVQVMVVSPNHESNVQQQVDLVSTMANMAVDVIAVAPSHEENLTQALNQASDNGKLIFSVDTMLDYKGSACYIGTNQYEASYEQGQYAAKLVEQNDTASAIILRGPMADKTHTLREEGLTDALADGCVTLVDVVDCECDEEIAEQTMIDLLTQHPEINVVCTTSDSMAVGAQRAIAGTGRKDVHIVSFDGMQEAAELVRIGEIDAVFAQDPYQIGRLCVDYALKLYQGEAVEPYIYTDVELITQGNAQAHMDEIDRRLDERSIIK